MLSKSEIEQYGGKAAILRYIADKLPTIPIPKFVVRGAGQSVDSVLAEFQSMKKPVTVRSSSPHEYAHFEGIFDSVQNVYTENDLIAGIKKVEQSAVSKRARTYATIHGFTIDERIHTIIQEQSPSLLPGAMMRHPNNPNLIFITCYSGSGRFQQDYYGFVYNEQTGRREESQFIAINEGLSENDAKFLVDKYKAVESLKDLSDGKVLYVEFGLKPFAFYQARPFKKIQTADFDLPSVNKNISLDTSLAFGITSPEGTVYPVLRSVGHNELQIAVDSAFKQLLGSDRDAPISIEYGDQELIDWAGNMMNLYGLPPEAPKTREIFAKMMQSHHAAFDGEFGEPYCFLTSSAKREDYDVDLTIPNMRGLVLGQAQSFLTHGLMRLIRQADVTLAFGPALVASDLYRMTKTKEDKIRIISNGKEAIAMRE